MFGRKIELLKPVGTHGGWANHSAAKRIGFECDLVSLAAGMLAEMTIVDGNSCKYICDAYRVTRL
jgi:hypothetical protein